MCAPECSLPFVRPQLIAIKQSAFVKLILLLLCPACADTWGMADKCQENASVALCSLGFLMYFNHLFALAKNVYFRYSNQWENKLVTLFKGNLTSVPFFFSVQLPSLCFSRALFVLKYGNSWVLYTIHLKCGW